MVFKPASKLGVSTTNVPITKHWCHFQNTSYRGAIGSDVVITECFLPSQKVYQKNRRMNPKVRTRWALILLSRSLKEQKHTAAPGPQKYVEASKNEGSISGSCNTDHVMFGVCKGTHIFGNSHVEHWPFGLFLNVLGHNVPYLWGPGKGFELWRASRGAIDLTRHPMQEAFANSRGPKDNINIRIPQTMISGIPLIVVLGTRMSDPYVYVGFWAPEFWSVQWRRLFGLNGNTIGGQNFLQPQSQRKN